MSLSRPESDFVSSSLSGALAAATTTMTIGTGLSIPATNSYLQIDYDSTTAVGSDNGPETVFYATYTTGTGAIAGMVRGQAGTADVAHANGAKVQMGASAKFYEGFVGASAYLSATLGTTVDNTLTKIALDAETYDVGADFASNKYVAPVNGYYLVNAAIQYGNCVADKHHGCYIYVDGAASFSALTTSGSMTTISATANKVIYLAASSYVELYYFHNSSATTPDINGGANLTYLTVTLIKEV